MDRVTGVTVNGRTAAHLRRYPPGVAFAAHRPGAADDLVRSVGGQRFGRDPDVADHAILARVHRPERPLPAAKVHAPAAYGHREAGEIADVTQAATAAR